MLYAHAPSLARGSPSTAAAAQPGEDEGADAVPVYPTEEKMRHTERLNEMKARGEAPEKRTHIVEDHHGDCGTANDEFTFTSPSTTIPGVASLCGTLSGVNRPTCCHSIKSC